MAEAHVFQNREVDETRRAHAIAIRIRRAVADEIKSEFAFRAFDATINLAGLWAETAQLRFRIHDRPGGNVAQRLFQNFDALAHFQHAHHVAVVNVAVFADRHLEIEPAVNAVFVHLAQVVIHAGGAQHRAGYGRVDRQFFRHHADELCASQNNFILGKKGSKLVEELAVIADNFFRLGDPFVIHVHTDAAKSHIIAHHPRTANFLEQVEDFFAFAEGIHHRRAERTHVLHKKADETGVVLEPRELRHDDTNVFGAFGNGQAGELLDCERVGPVVRHRTKIIQPVGVGHRGEIRNVLADLLVVAMQIAEHRLELYDRFAIQHHVHPEHAMRGRMMRPHGNFKQLADGRAALVELWLHLKTFRRHGGDGVHAFTSAFGSTG